MRGITNVRLRNYDYHSGGYYFVTLVSKLRENIFDYKVKLVERELQDLKAMIKGLDIDYYEVMPNHVHIIFVLENCALQLGEIVRCLKAKVSHSFGRKVWQANYYEYVIRNEKALEGIREYIINNPEAELLKFQQFYASSLADESASYIEKLARGER